MKNWITCFLIVFMILGVTACAPAQPTVQATTMPTVALPTNTTSSPRTCRPTLDDGVSPSYKPNAPEQTVVGHGHVVTGVVLSSVDCQPIANAKLEFWPEIGEMGHPDSQRATFFTDSEGRYRFECDPPHHIHMRISAEGYKTIGVNSYHPEGEAEGTLDIVLVPEK